jgi:hypothetical protein
MSYSDEIINAVCLDHANEPFPEWIKGDVEYYKKRYSETSDLHEKARYAYAVWVFEKNIDFAKKAVHHFLECGEFYFTKGWYNQGSKYVVMAFCFAFAAKLSFSLRLQAPLDGLTILKKIAEIIVKMDSEQIKGRGMIDLIDVVAKIAEDNYSNKTLRESDAAKQEISNVLSVAIRIGEEWHQKKEFHWYRSYLSAAALLTKFKDSPEQALQLKIKGADSYVEEAESRSGSNLVKVAFYQDALRLYSELGLTNKMAEVRKRIKECSEKAVGEFKEISVPITIPMNEIISSVTRDMVGKSPHGILENLARDRSFVPKKSMVIKAVEEMRKTAPLTFMIPTTVFTKDAPRKKVTGDKEIFEYNVKRQFMILSQANRKVLSEVLDEIFSLFVEEDDLVKFLGKSRNISKNSLAILSTAIEHHFCAEYVASVHVFVPQVEELIRTLLTNRGKAPTKYAPAEEGVEEKLLGGLLQEVAQYLDDDFAEYLDVLLTPSGENIRNKVCHGWMESEKFDRELSNTFIDVLLKLSVL